MISVIFSRRSNHSNIACRKISTGCRNVKENPLCFGNYVQLLGDSWKFGPKIPRPQKFERFDRREKLSELFLVCFKSYLHAFNFPKKSNRERFRAILTSKTEILQFRNTFSRERYTTFRVASGYVVNIATISARIC